MISGPQIKIIELLDRGCTLEIRPRCCAEGHHLLIHFKAIKNKNLLCEFTTTAKVEEHTREEGDKEKIQVGFLQYDEESWKKFRSTFTFRQDQINQFLKAARGW